ncbi:hypothetical protein LSH36_246g01004 [Paralvinella palmiformis]|uniref:Peptidase M14 domain-containing protein n=1 Tax=Paralvinella palmiformis TaxID=53620 RepID=A0AAD9JL36_9ANNE|nr:hypothetical protein LSH36_246g01004 [Paralvinella palmiformis]
MILIVLVLLTVSSLTFGNRHNRDKAVQVRVQSADEWLRVENVLEKYLKKQDIDIWAYPNHNGKANLLIPGDLFNVIANQFDLIGLSYDVTVDDVSRLLDDIDVQLQEWNKEHKGIVGKYPTYDEILAWFDELKTNYSGWIDTLDIGNTYDGRIHRSLKISTGGTGKWKVYIEGAMHAREWISPATVIYITDQLIQGYANGDPEIVEWMEMLDWYILPVANPDGYDYCFTDDRLWRKNRRPNNGTNCVGTDLNRNWSYQWGGVGADPDPCSNTYRGEHAESEVEVQNIVNLIMPEAEQFIYYMAYHSWGQQFFTRWDYTADEVPSDHEQLLDLAHRAVNAIVAVHDMYYEAGTAPELMYAFSGSSADWARGVAGIKYPYLEELRDNGTYSFILPPEQIVPTGEESWAGFQVVVREIVSKCSGISPPGPCLP